MSDNEDDRSDDVRDTPRVWPAQRLQQLTGDEFGNRALYLWHCRDCTGYFEAVDPDRDGCTVVGLIAVTRLPGAFEGELAAARANAHQKMLEKACGCEYHRFFSDPITRRLL